MKSTKSKLLGSVKKMAVSSLKADANSTTCAFIYQPKAPASLKQFSRIDK